MSGGGGGVTNCVAQGRPRHVTRVLEFARDERVLQGVAVSRLALSPLQQDGTLLLVSDSDEGEGVGRSRSEGADEAGAGRSRSNGGEGETVERPASDEREGRGHGGGDASDYLPQQEEGGGGSECAEEEEEEWRRWEWEHLHPEGVLRHTKEVAGAVERCRRLTLSASKQASQSRWTT